MLREEYTSKNNISAGVNATLIPQTTYADKIKGVESFVVRIDPNDKEQTVETTKQ